MARPRVTTLAVVVVALFQFTLFLNNRDITSSHEGRVASTAREILERHDWIIPYSNGVPRLAKPPLAYWATAAAWSIAGERSAWLARLPAALCGALAVLMVMDLARRTLGQPAALWAGVVWVTTWFIVDEYRKAMADPYLAFLALACVWAWIAADQSTKRGVSRALLLLAYAAAALGALAKGHLILLHAAFALLPYHIVRRRCPRMALIHAAGVVLMLVIALPWFLHIYRMAGNVWASDAVGIETNSAGKWSPPWHYLAALPATAAPWTVFTIIGALMPLLARRRRERRAFWPLLWLAGTVLVFSLVPMKKNAYLLPAMPAQALLTAAALAAFVRVPRAKKNAVNERNLLAAHLVGAIAAFAVCLYLTANIEHFEIDPPAPLMAAGASAALLLMGIRWLAPSFRAPRTILITALMFGLCVHAVVAWIVPDADNRRSDAPFAVLVNEQTSHGGPLHLIGPGLREDALFYLARTVPKIASIDALPANYTGSAIVTADQYPAVLKSDRGDELASSASRSAKDRLYLFRFPKAPPATPQPDR